MDDLIRKLGEGSHPIAAERSKSPLDLREQIGRKFVLLKFTGTQGGTELGSELDMTLSDTSSADFEQGTGSIHLVGTLTLNSQKVQLVADIDVATSRGTGHLVPID